MPRSGPNHTEATPEQPSVRVLAHLNGAALAPLSAGQSIAQESFKLLARRAQAYADWADAVSHSTTPAQLMQAFSTWLTRLPEDYVRASADLANSVATQPSGQSK